MSTWDALPPPNLEVVDRGHISISSGSTATVEDVANEGEQLLVAYGHTSGSTDATDVAYRLDDDNANQTQDLIFDEQAASGDAEIGYTVMRVIP